LYDRYSNRLDEDRKKVLLKIDERIVGKTIDNLFEKNTQDDKVEYMLTQDDLSEDDSEEYDEDESEDERNEGD